MLKQLRVDGALPIEEISQPTPEHLTAILVLTGGVEREVLKVVAQLPSPTLLIAHSGHNSLPAALEILARIRQDGGEGRILFGAPPEIAAGLKQELVLAHAWETLRFTRIGLIGEPSDWLVASDVDERSSRDVCRSSLCKSDRNFDRDQRRQATPQGRRRSHEESEDRG